MAKKKSTKKENREVKSDTFSMLMEYPEYALEVYNAVNGSHYEDPTQLQIVTLKKGISLTVRNDASIILDNYLNLFEHQSTYSPNLPLRLLIYFVDIIKAFIVGKNIFDKIKVKIPTPKFVVFYNGLEKRPEKEILKLSDVFEHPTGHPEIELLCTIYNINPGYNEELLQNCSVLREYIEFIQQIRENQENDEKEPIKKAIDYCIEHNILKEFLQQRKSEVLKSMVLDYTYETRLEMTKRDYKQIGLQKGLKQGLQQGLEAFILDKIEDQCPEDEIIKKLEKRFSLTEAKAKEYLKKYGKSLIQEHA